MAYTEFYCESGGSNLNGGSNTGSFIYRSTNGNWNGSTTFTPTDGTNPVSAGVVVGQMVSVYLDAATVGVYINRVTAVTNSVNGPITVANALGAGTAPTSGASGRTITVGGAFLGPNAATGFPFILSAFGSNNTQDSSAHEVRVNLKNDQTYSLTASFAIANSSAMVVQGYTSSVGDGGRATFDGGTSTAQILSDIGAAGTAIIDIIFKTSFTTGSTDLVTEARLGSFIRCVFTGARGNGVNAAIVGSTLIECEAYDCNKSNTASTGGIKVSSSCHVLRCISHDHSGNNANGFICTGGPMSFQNCISDTNGKYGFQITGTSQNGLISINNCDAYNNGSDAINIITGGLNPVWIENCNFIKNTGAGVNNVSILNPGYIYNCGYGAGTQANGSSDTVNNFTKTGTVTYVSNLTPWVDPANGDFRINLSAANFAGRSVFTQTASSYSGAVGFPDIGAAQSLTGSGGTFSKETSHSAAS